VSWLFPWMGFSEHPPTTAADGAYVISQVVEAVLTGPDWASTVLIVNYDENDGHFDHVPPPQPPSQGEYPDEFVPGPSPGTYLSIGAGFRVPCFIISPWTLGRGICSDQYDHTSVLRFLKDVTSVDCPNIGAWRRATFGSLSSASPSGFNGLGAPLSAVPLRPDAVALRRNAIDRYNNTTVGVGADGWTQTAVGQLVPDPQPPWPPAAQACQVTVMLPVFGPDQPYPQPGASFGDALTVTVSGFEPAELTTPYAGYRPVRRFGLPTGSGLKTITALKPPNRRCSTRVPDVTITDSGGNPVAIEAACQYVDLDPGSPANRPPSGVPQQFIFYYSLTFTDPAATFGSGDQMLSALATFQVDITVTDQVEFEVAVSPAEFCAGLAAGIVQRYDNGGPPVTKADKDKFMAQLTACREQKQLTQARYEQAVHDLQELNLMGQPPGLPGGGVNPPP
jgi:Phosphoesterase family